jgi:hypothetical protein
MRSSESEHQVVLGSPSNNMGVTDLQELYERTKSVSVNDCVFGRGFVLGRHFGHLFYSRKSKQL